MLLCLIVGSTAWAFEHGVILVPDYSFLVRPYRLQIVDELHMLDAFGVGQCLEVTAKSCKVYFVPCSLVPALLSLYLLFDVRSIYVVANLFVDPGWIDHSVDGNCYFVLL